MTIKRASRRVEALFYVMDCERNRKVRDPRHRTFGNLTFFLSDTPLEIFYSFGSLSYLA
ncbi:hypothetical protein [Halobacillus halophilus]|uniref:hypothetical protein n=1 Tax=Halobacillus halophilus TaxID=1570 RepID=UPI001CD5D6C2|nr:hypothetical protein [Halobacillus halophilus]MCA1011733.1 hypothetical protein [Halobacillus halophilus]